MKLFFPFLVFVAASHPVPYNASRTLFVDHVGKNFLFRGGSLLSEDLKSLNVSAALNRMGTLLAKHGLEMDGEPFMMDVCLLNPEDANDTPSIQLERDFFSQNALNESFYLHPIHGESVSPAQSDNATHWARSYRMWSRDSLPALVEIIRTILVSPMQTGEPLLIYVHCMEGVDRTGEVVGAYMMQWMGKTLDEVLAIDRAIKGGKLPKKHNVWAMQWFALSIRQQ